MALTRGQLLAHAAAQVGTMERTGRNDVVYADYWGITGQAWCYAFVNWLFDTLSSRLEYVTMYVPHGVQYSRDVAQSIERGGAPQPGDLVHFTWDMVEWPPHRPGTGDHVGIVESWDGGDTLVTIEGNVGSPQGVWRMQRPIGATVINFWRPANYVDGTVEEDMDSTQNQRLIDVEARTLYMQTLMQNLTNVVADIRTVVGYLLNDTKTQDGLQVGPAVGNLAREMGNLHMHVEEAKNATSGQTVATGQHLMDAISRIRTGEPYLDVEKSLQQATDDQLSRLALDRLARALCKASSPPPAQTS